MPEVRKKTKEIDHYVKQNVGEALLQLRELVIVLHHRFV